MYPPRITFASHMLPTFPLGSHSRRAYQSERQRVERCSDTESIENDTGYMIGLVLRQISYGHPPDHCQLQVSRGAASITLLEVQELMTVNL